MIQRIHGRVDEHASITTNYRFSTDFSFLCVCVCATRTSEISLFHFRFGAFILLRIWNQNWCLNFNFTSSVIILWSINTSLPSIIDLTFCVLFEFILIQWNCLLHMVFLCDSNTRLRRGQLLERKIMKCLKQVGRIRVTHHFTKYSPRTYGSQQ